MLAPSAQQAPLLLVTPLFRLRQENRLIHLLASSGVTIEHGSDRTCVNQTATSLPDLVQITGSLGGDRVAEAETAMLIAVVAPH